MAKHDHENKTEYGNTLNLPQTDFPMRGNLPQKEPDILAKWEEMDMYHRIGKKNAGKPKFILHDGPPYANGDIHLGHAMNKVLKDMIVKYKNMTGFVLHMFRGGIPMACPLSKKPLRT